MNFTQREQEILETDIISFPFLSKYDFHFIFMKLGYSVMWRSYCTKSHPIKSRHVESTCRSSFKAQNITVTCISTFCKELLKQIIWK